MKSRSRQRINELAEIDQREGIKTKFNVDRQRAIKFGYEIENVYFDFSKTYLSEELLSEYIDYANDIGFKDKRYQFLSGEKINSTEDRSVLHTLLRDSKNQGIPVKEAQLAQALVLL